MNHGISFKIDGDPAPIHVEYGYIALRSSVDFLVPDSTVMFRDRMSSFVSTYPFMQDTTVDVTLDDGNNTQTYSFYAFSSKKGQSLRGVEEFDTGLTLISSYCNPLVTESEYHSKTCTASDYVKYLADRCGLAYDVEETDSARAWLNPNFKYAQMLRRLARRSVARSGSSGFLYFVTTDGTLVFKSVDALFDNGTVHDITVGSYTDSSTGEDIQVNNKIFSLVDNHFANVALGSNSLTMRTYDYKTGKYVETIYDSESGVKKRGAVRGVSNTLVNTGSGYYGGNWYSAEYDLPTLVVDYNYNKIQRQLESTQLSLMLPLNLNIRIGDIVNLSIPANPDIIEGGVNMNYSGKYLVKSNMIVGHGQFMNRLVLVRPGMSLDKERATGYK